MIIDCHVHLLPARVREDRSNFLKSDRAFGSLYASAKAKLASPGDIIDYMDRAGIDKAVVFGFPWEDWDEVKVNNDEIWEFHHQYPERIVPFAVLSPLGGEHAITESRRTLQGGFAGIGELAVYDGGWTREGFAALSPVLTLAASHRVPVMIHVNEPVGHDYSGKISVDFSGLVEIIRSHPDVDFILAHFGGGVFVYGLMPEVAKVLRRTYLDTAASPFLYDWRIYGIAARIMGPEKILFGSDFPLLPMSRYIKELDLSGIDPELREGILGKNAKDLLGGGFATAP